MGRNVVQEKVAQNELYRSVFTILTSSPNLLPMFISNASFQEPIVEKLRKYDYENISEFQMELNQMIGLTLTASGLSSEIPENILMIIQNAYKKMGYDPITGKRVAPPTLPPVPEILFKYENDYKHPKTRKLETDEWIAQLDFAGERIRIGTYPDEVTATVAYSDFLARVGDTKDGLNAVIEKAHQAAERNDQQFQELLYSAVECATKTYDFPYQVWLPGFVTDGPIDTMDMMNDSMTPNRPPKKKKRRWSLGRTKRTTPVTHGATRDPLLRVPQRPGLMCSHVRGQELTVLTVLSRNDDLVALGKATSGRIYHYQSKELVSPMRFCKLGGCRKKQPYHSTYVISLNTTLYDHMQVCDELDSKGNLIANAANQEDSDSNDSIQAAISRVKRKLNESPAAGPPRRNSRASSSASNVVRRRTSRVIQEIKTSFRRRSNVIESDDDDEEEDTTAQWRKDLKENDRVDLKDSRDQWWEVQVLETKAATKKKPKRIFIQYVISQQLPFPDQGEWFDITSEDLAIKGENDTLPAYSVCSKCFMCGVMNDMMLCKASDCFMASHNDCSDARRNWLCESHDKK